MRWVSLLGVIATIVGLVMPDPVWWPTWGNNTLWLFLGINFAFLIAGRD